MSKPTGIPLLIGIIITWVFFCLLFGGLLYVVFPVTIGQAIFGGMGLAWLWIGWKIKKLKANGEIDL